jgi:diguanylate cyclase (GGDEF)-like protein
MSSIESKHDTLLLSRLQLFRNVNLNNQALLDLLDLCEYRQLAKGEVILSTEEENKYLYVITNGRLVIRLGEHEDIPLVTVEQGECVGEMSIVDSGIPSAKVVAFEKTEVLVIDQDILWRMISVSHDIARNMLYIMAERLRYSNLVVADSLEMQRKYQRYATMDALTGLHNRGWMDEIFDREVKRSERDVLPLATIMIDVDDFKNYNDTYGHLAGDKVLAMVADALRKPLRPNDMVARFGGEEFAVMLPETTLDNAVTIAERLRLSVSQSDPGKLDGKQLPKVTISLGVASRQKKYTLDMLITAADTALYQAKSKGKNCVEVSANTVDDDN